MNPGETEGSAEGTPIKAAEISTTETATTTTISDEEFLKKRQENAKYQKPAPPPPEGMSKREWKRELRRQQLDSMKEMFAEKRREKRREKRAAVTAENKRQREDGADQGEGEMQEKTEQETTTTTRQAKKPRHNKDQERSNVKVIIDCGFDEYMKDRERTSLAIQLNRAYSENRKARRAIDLHVTSFNKKLKERFDGPMHKQYEQWKSSWIKFSEDDFVVRGTSETTDSKDSVQDDIQAEKPSSTEETSSTEKPKKRKGHGTELNVPCAAPIINPSDVVYLSSDSDTTLTALEEGKTYVIGGIVDKGRYKNLCKDKAEKQSMQTAKLPIDEYIRVSGRRVLTTNHVFEILLQWLDTKDWKEAFERVLPARKMAGADEDEDEDDDEN